MKLVYLVGFIIKKFVTMHGHVNVKNVCYSCFLFTLDKGMQLRSGDVSLRSDHGVLDRSGDSILLR